MKGLAKKCAATSSLGRGHTPALLAWATPHCARSTAAIQRDCSLHPRTPGKGITPRADK